MSNGPSTLRPSDAEGAQTRRPLGEDVLIIGPGWECQIKAGEHLIGRDSSCRLCVADGLASREHARLRVRAEGVSIVDLDSANGVFVNNVRISEPRLLFHGDRVLIGSTELSVFNATLGQSSVFPEDDERPTLTGTTDPPPQGATVRANAVAVLGRVAERFLAAGDPERAKTVLADQMVKVLEGARSGIRVPRDLCLDTSRYALMLAKALHDGNWINFTMELHLRAKHPMRPETLDELIAAAAEVRSVDATLFGHYVEWLERHAGRRSSVTKMVAQRLRSLDLPTGD